MNVIKKITSAIKIYFKLLNTTPDTTNVLLKKLSPKSDREGSIWINVLLFAVTLATTTFAGAQGGSTFREIIISGLPFSVSIMSILLAHEMGHYLAARHFGVKATLPYFIPFPSIIGTMGAIIKIKSPIKERRALLYIGALGPIPGFLLSLAASIIGIYLSEVKKLPASTDGMTPIFGDSLLFSFMVKLMHGDIPAGSDIYLSPYAWAGWIGFLVTSLNLMPIGQLDGGHIIYSLIGRKQLIFGWSALTGLVILSFFWPGWLVWVAITLMFLMVGHPQIADNSNNLSAAEKVVGWLCIIIFIITFIPMPVKFI
jgi:membrane-associated protease RseP (regulator of RpoE activity)